VTRKLNQTQLALVTFVTLVVGLGLKAKFGSDWWEFAGFSTGVIGVYLVAIEHMINWPVGLANVAIYAWVFFGSRLYADMSLQFFFFALGIHGWWQWARGGEGKSELTISRIQKTGWYGVALIWAVGTAVYYPIIKHFNGSAPLIDSSLTVMSIIAQVQLNLKKLENWILWIAVDIVYIPLYVSRNLVATAVLYTLLLVLAISGLIGWQKAYRNLAATSDPVAAL
jgi:nicotinamide mononucleotide transporter